MNVEVHGDRVARKGLELANLLDLTPQFDNNRYYTAVGDKTSVGLYLTVKRFIMEAEVALNT